MLQGMLIAEKRLENFERKRKEKEFSRVRAHFAGDS